MQWYRPSPRFQRLPLLVKIFFLTVCFGGIMLGGALLGWAASQVF
jgi:hypothetical protein